MIGEGVSDGGIGGGGIGGGGVGGELLPDKGFGTSKVIVASSSNKSGSCNRASIVVISKLSLTISPFSELRFLLTSVTLF